MDWYYYIALAAIISQSVFLVQMLRNYRYVIKKYKKPRKWHCPTALFVPCKGRDINFKKNIASFFNQDYEDYILWFVVADKSDPAYSKLCQIKEKLAKNSKAKDIQILVSGQGQSCSQKIHNLLYCYKLLPENIEIMAFADSDICTQSNWLKQLVYPLRKSENGAASGYRWFIPKTNNLATLALSAVNAKIAQLLGNSRFNQVWGGSMAIRVDTFRQIGLDKIWPKSLSDDLSLSCAVKKAKKKVVFVPACIVPSYESTTWQKLFEFARRQFLITRISATGTWWFGFISSIYSIAGLWAGAALAIYAASINNQNQLLYTTVPIFFFVSQLIRAILRQKMIRKVLPQHISKMKIAMFADICFFWVWSWLLFLFIISSAFGNIICWRGIRYKMLGPSETIIVKS